MKNIYRFIQILPIFVFLITFNFTVSADQATFKSLLKEADQLRDEKSYQLAIPKYKQILALELEDQGLQREVQFKLADCSWRTKNSGLYPQAIKELKVLIESEKDDRWQVEAAESLAEHYLEVDRYSHQNEIKSYLEMAREYWAGSSDIELARVRFIKSSFTLGDFISQNWGWGYRGIAPSKMYRGKIVPQDPNQSGLDVLYEEILSVAKSDEDKAKVYYSLAMAYFNQYYDSKKKEQALKYLENILKKFPNSEWADDAFYYTGQYYEQANDLVSAVKIYREYLEKYKRGDSRWVDDIHRQLANITGAQMNLNTSYTFVPGSDIQFNLSWRNIKQARVQVYELNLVDQLKLDLKKSATDGQRGINHYSELIKRIVDNGQYAYQKKVLDWTIDLKEEGKYQYYSEAKSLAHWLEGKAAGEKIDDPDKAKLKAGAYLLLAQSGDVQAYDLLLVSDLGVVTKTAGETGLIFAFDGKTGEPRPQAQVKYHYRYYDDNGNWQWVEESGVTDESGLVKIQFKTSQKQYYGNQHQVFAVVKAGDMQAFAQGNYYPYGQQAQQWRLYAYSDRPAYRPNEEISFKATIRRYGAQTYTTPSAMAVNAVIYDPRGNKVFEKKYTLNEFGSLFDKLTLDDKASLGEYRLHINDAKNNNHLMQTVLFRLEEYKLPEFTVQIQPKKEEETKTGVSTYRLGDIIEMELDAQYYFGGAVADAQVEYLVYQSPYCHQHFWPRDYWWYYPQENYQSQYYYQKQLIVQEKIKTDHEGKAYFNFETPENVDTDLVYIVEARVVDQSRREIHGTAEIKVTKHAFYAYLNPKQNLYRPGDRAEVEIKTLTANDEPVSVDGKITITRNWWKEPVVMEDRVAEQGHYDQTEILSKFVKTDKDGKTVFSFEPERDGYYQVHLTAFDENGNEITAQTNVFVCAKSSTDLGYKYGGLQIIPEKESFVAGETARVMVVANKPGTWVLFTREAEEIFDYQVLHLDGSVKLIEFPVDKKDIPNIFLNVVSAEEFQLKSHSVEIIVPPDEKFLNVKILSDQATYQPQEEGVFEIEVTDKNGQPVQSEISLGIVDGSVYYIQQEFVQDIRQFFYGEKRQQAVQMNTSFYQRAYQSLDLFADKKGTVVTENERIEGQVFGYDAYYGESNFSVSGGLAARELAASPQMAMKSVIADAVMPSVAEESVRGRRDNLQKKMEFRDKGAGQKMDQDELPTPAVRQDFRSTIVWQPAVITNKEGKAVVKMKFPDSLTTWRATARSMTTDTRVGSITHEVKTNKDVIVRLQAPRFFTERDQVTISANVHNYTDSVQKIKTTIQAEGLDVQGKKEVWITVPAQGEQRVDWPALVLKQGEARITVAAQAKEDADAMVKTYPVIPHGIEKFIAAAVDLKGDKLKDLLKELTVNAPKERIKESASLQIHLSPSLAATMLDALPYLAQYPYGCVEQTMSRFLPTIIVKKALKDLGLTDQEIHQYLSDVLIARNDPAHPQRKDYSVLPELDKMIKDGLNRLYDFQHSDGGWGWWKEGNSDRFMSAYVIWGLSLAQDAGVKIRKDVFNKGIGFLQKELVEEEENPDTLAWMLHALGHARSQSSYEQKQTQRLWQMREQLNPYTRALFALSLYYRGNKEQAETLARNLAN
ncbi:MAG: tetratricopeptide repeat protein, partial [Candidatus Omnitrophica bacterium]|nr:tetratricopeptide repeat protein [Candidatus Omnitrophota bacterium]